MPVVDDRGRLFGRLNLIDAIVGIFVLLLVPLAYGAFLLFRAPVPAITSLTPAAIAERAPAVIAITGTDLRPYLRARVGAVDAKFLVQSPTAAEIQVPALPPGTYDLALFDESKRVLLRPGAVTVHAIAAARAAGRFELQAVGAFVGLSNEIAATIGVGGTSGQPGGEPSAEIVAVRPPEPDTSRVKIGPAVFAVAPLTQWRVPAIVRLRCLVGGGVCTIGGAAVSQGATITVPIAASANRAAGQGTPIAFQIGQLFPPGLRAAFPSVVTARVRFVGGSELVGVMKAGDADMSVVAAEDRALVFGEQQAVLVAVGADQQSMTALTTGESVLRRGLQLQQPVVAFTCTVRIPAVFTPSGWSYKDRPVKIGAPFVFESVSGAMTGWILDVKP